MICPECCFGDVLFIFERGTAECTYHISIVVYHETSHHGIKINDKDLRPTKQCIVQFGVIMCYPVLEVLPGQLELMVDKIEGGYLTNLCFCIRQKVFCTGFQYFMISLQSSGEVMKAPNGIAGKFWINGIQKQLVVS